MENLSFLLLWTLVTLGVSSYASILGKRYGVEFPLAIMAALVVIAAVLANKLIQIGPFVVPGGVIVASATFLITDILCERWSRIEAQKAVWIGFYALFLFVLSLEAILYWPGPAFALDKAKSFHEVLGLTPRILLGSVLAYLVSQNHDVWAYEFWKRKTEGRHLWLRNNASTIVSQGLDSAIFITVSFYGVFPIGPMILDLWLIKIVIALLDTPFIYFVRWVIDRYPISEYSPIRGNGPMREVF